MIQQKLSIAMAAIVGLSLGMPRAFGDLVSFDLTNPNAGGLSCCSGPYATVTVNRTSSTEATVTFDSLTSGGFLYLLAGHAAADLNVNASTFTASFLGTNSLAGFTPGPYSNGGSGNVSSFGTFNLEVDSHGGFTNSATEIVIHLSDASGTWGSASDVLAANNDGSTAAIHGFACAEPGCSSSSGAYNTGFASNGSAVTESAAFGLWAGLAVMGILGAWRKRAGARS